MKVRRRLDPMRVAVRELQSIRIHWVSPPLDRIALCLAAAGHLLRWQFPEEIATRTLATVTDPLEAESLTADLRARGWKL